jgi:N-acetylmuramoyl-L-alanine amidase
VDKVTVIDAGHGGRDPGAVDGIQPAEGDTIYTEEDNLNLDVALQTAKYLAPISQVILTRTEDVNVMEDPDEDLYERPRISTRAGAHAFVSIHQNAATNPAGHGLEVYHYPGSTEGKRLAEAVYNRLLAATGLYGRGIKEAYFAVIGRLNSAPAILVEGGFITNPEEERILNSPEHKQKAAWAIAQGVADFLGATLPDPAAQDPNAITVEIGDLRLPGKIIDGAAYGPIRKMFEAAGLGVQWVEATRTVKIDLGGL